MKCNLPSFSFMVCAFAVLCNKFLSTLNLQGYAPVFSFRSFIILALTFRFVIQLELYFVDSVKQEGRLIFSMFALPYFPSFYNLFYFSSFLTFVLTVLFPTLCLPDEGLCILVSDGVSLLGHSCHLVFLPLSSPVRLLALPPLSL